MHIHTSLTQMHFHVHSGKPVGAGAAGMAWAIPLFQDNNVIVFILQNLQHASHDSEAGKHIPRLLVC